MTKKWKKKLEKIYNDLESKAFVDYRVDIQAMLKDKEFHALSLDEKLRVYMRFWILIWTMFCMMI